MPTVVTFPTCHWCERIDVDVWKCRSCLFFTCGDCFKGFNSSDRCTHVKYIPLVDDGWDDA